jgi:hypothetical protein
VRDRHRERVGRASEIGRGLLRGERGNTVLVDECGQTEVGDVDLVVLIDQYILGLEIAMTHSHQVHVLDCID